MIAEKLNKLGIFLKTGYSTGVHHTTCPQCSPSRKKKHVKCLKVTIDAEGALYFCHHCNQFFGGIYANSEAHRDFKPKKGPKPGGNVKSWLENKARQKTW